MTARPLSHLVAEGRSLLAEATLGEWAAVPPGGIVPTDYWVVGTVEDGLLERFASAGPHDGFDAMAIAWAMTNLPHLLDAFDRVNALLRRWAVEGAYQDLSGELARGYAAEVRKALEGEPTS
ncbi:hypothetical protein [Nocardia sp. NPDC051833]|uniref:hypothetical protein n=1 Tax=Nocardia sp. NPDC051833 TaxID=3155674 RepID=UPI0034129183